MKLLKASTFVTILLLNAIITLGIMSLRVQPVRGGGAGATKNGDVNCDDKIDISDAISILQFQFAGGPPLCALAQDNFATKEELATLADQVAILTESAKKTMSFAEGEFDGDGVNVRNIQTGLPGKVRAMWIFFENEETWVATGFRMDTMTPPGVEYQGMAFQPDNSVSLIGASKYQVNSSGFKYRWFAFSSPE